MKISYLFSLGLFLSSALTHLYLSFRFYSLKADKATGKTLCYISENWNCDTALSSGFSEIFNLPLSHFGFAFNILCLLVLVLMKWNFWENKNTGSLCVWIISLVLALGSLVMFFISLVFLKSFCPLCVLSSLFSLLVLWPLKKSLPLPRLEKFSIYAKPVLWMIIGTACCVFLLKIIGMQFYSVRNVEKFARSNFMDWKRSLPHSSLNQDQSFLSSGPDRSQAKLTLVEFADLLCPHCSKTYLALKTFQQAHPKIRVEYMAFPLNSEGCTEKLASSLSSSCALSKSLFCSEKQQLGLKLQDLLYTEQKWFLQRRGNLSEIQNRVKSHLKEWGVDEKLFQECMESSAVTEVIFKHIQQGRLLGIQGTPSLFVEGKNIKPFAFSMTLTAILKDRNN